MEKAKFNTHISNSQKTSQHSPVSTEKIKRLLKTSLIKVLKHKQIITDVKILNTASEDNQLQGVYKVILTKC